MINFSKKIHDTSNWKRVNFMFKYIPQLLHDPKKSMLWKSKVHSPLLLYILVLVEIVPPEMQPYLCISEGNGRVCINNFKQKKIYKIKAICHSACYLTNFKSILLFFWVHRITDPNKHFCMCVKYKDILW